MTGSGRGRLRGGLVLLAGAQLVVGGWMLLSPRTFYDRVPTVAMYPPYSQHLLSDLGGSYVALGVALLISAITLGRQVVHTTLVSYLICSVAHLTYHATHRDGMPPLEMTALLAGFAALVAIAAGLLTLAAGMPTHTARTSDRK